MKTHETHVRIYYKDIDQMGIVYYSRYLEYFEMARTEYLRDLGVDVTTIERNGYYLPVISSHCNYKEGARFEDEIIIETRIRTLPRPKLTIEYRIVRKKDLRELVNGYTVHAFISTSGRPVRPPKSFTTILSNHIKQ